MSRYLTAENLDPIKRIYHCSATMEQDQRGEVLECGKVLLIGAALLDQIVHVSSDFLRENQLEANATYHCNREPRLYAVVERFERDYGHQIIRKPGGSAFNTALHYHSLYQGNNICSFLPIALRYEKI